MDLTYYGISAFKAVANDGTTLLMDPAIEDNPHCELSVEDFDDIDHILVTHGAFDHLGDAPAIAELNDAPIITDPATNAVLQKQGFPVDLIGGYVTGMELDFDSWSVKVVKSEHVSMFHPGKGGGDFEDVVIGPAMGFFVSIDEHVVYHMGDTSIFKDIELFAELYEPTVSLVPIGEVNFEYLPELYPDEAAMVVEWLDSDVVVPTHYPLETDKVDRVGDFLQHCEERGVTDRTDIEPMQPGETITV